jgi:hypothetical protein
MQYKVLPAPQNLPIPTEYNNYIIGGTIAEKYKKGDLNLILQEYNKHRAVGEKNFEEEILEPIEKFTAEERHGKEIIEKDSKKYIKVIKKKK